MSEAKLRELSMEFFVDIIELVKHLKFIKESIISNQIGRNGTSIGANIHEAQTDYMLLWGFFTPWLLRLRYLPH